MEILEERGKVYGNFKMNLLCRADIMATLNQVAVSKTGRLLSNQDYQAINDIVIKLARLAASPEHKDSWEDIAGYATLNLERLKDIK